MARAKKSLGQNFLVDPGLQKRIVDALDAEADDEVLEIGPGTGALTQHLAGTVRRLVAVELDDRLIEQLREELGDRPGVEFVHADALELEPSEWLDDFATTKVVGNIPYNITTPLIFWLLERAVRPERAVLMVQKEVADRILAEPGGKTYGALSVGVRAVAAVERLFNVRRGAFRPVPDVDSTVIRIWPHQPGPMSAAEERDLRTLTRTAFSWRRKQLRTTLRSAPEYRVSPDDAESVAREVGIGLDARPETLSPETFIDLARALRRVGYPRSGTARTPEDA